MANVANKHVPESAAQRLTSRHGWRNHTMYLGCRFSALGFPKPETNQVDIEIPDSDDEDDGNKEEGNKEEANKACLSSAAFSRSQ